MYDFKFTRNNLSDIHQTKIRTSKFAIIGLGGVGGFVFENLIRLGAENFIIFENDRFELSNFNRQILSDDEFLDQPKINSALARSKKINSEIKIDYKNEFNFDSNLEANILIDCSDNIQTRIISSRKCRLMKIPYVFCSANDSRGIISVFIDESFEDSFQIKPPFDNYKKCSSILCPSAAISGSLGASMAINYLIDKPLVRAPMALFFDLFSKDLFSLVELK